MTNRENAMAVLNYQKYNELPIVHFGYWNETIQKWVSEGHISSESGTGIRDGSENETIISKALGFDFNWYNCFHPKTGLNPDFESKVVEVMADGGQKVFNSDGVIVLKYDNAGSIPAEVGHTLVDRQSWEEYYLPKLKFTSDRINFEQLKQISKKANRKIPKGLYCGSLFGQIRNWIGVEGVGYLYVDDEELYREIIDTVGGLEYSITKTLLEAATAEGIEFDFAHFWEDICFKNGPLVIPEVFDEMVGPHYKMITDLCRKHGINIISLDCDGLIDSLIPTWFNNGVNTMFPIEVGTWEAEITPWREKYGKELRGVGGMNKCVFARDYSAVDAEIERLKRLVDLGGYIPCPDHRIAPDAKWENVQYYCDKMRKAFRG